MQKTPQRELRHANNFTRMSQSRNQQKSSTQKRRDKKGKRTEV